MPDNIPELFTLQSRRTHLITDGQSVTGYYTHGGDTLETLNAFPEPMTTWQKKKDGSAYVPRHYEANRNMWRDFSAIISNVPDSRQPGVIQWLTELQSQQILEADRILQFGMCAITYGSQNCGVDNSFSDSLSFHADLLAEAGSAWRMKIEDQIRFTDKVAFALAVLVGEIAVAAGKHEVERKTVVPPSQADLKLLEERGRVNVYFRFPELKENCSTCLVLTDVKTDSSVRRVYVPETVARELLQHKKRQDAHIAACHGLCNDYDLVLAQDNGRPLETHIIDQRLKRFINENGFGKVVFHSFRALSTTDKLQLSGGDIKAVQGDTGHASPKMVTEQYSRIRDLDRRRLAGLMEQAYFGGSTAPKITPDEDAALSMLRENPEVLKLLLAMKK